jgi:hypothetical protein
MSTISASTTSTTAYKVTADTTGTLVFQTGASPTTALTISSAQVATFAQAPVLPSASIPQAALAAGVAGNGPSFSASVSAAQLVSNATFTKVACNSEAWDTASCYDNATNYRFTPNVAGYYLLTGYGQISAGSTLTRIITSFYKNGSTIGRQNDLYPPATASPSWFLNSSAYVYLNGSTDYVEMYVYIQGTATNSLYVGANDANTFYFQGAMVRAA